MRIYKYLSILFFSTLIFTSCDGGYQFKITSAKKVSINKKATFTLTEVTNKQVDSIHFFLNGKRMNSVKNSVIINSTETGVGKHAITALVFYPQKTKKMNSSLEVLSNTSPDIYTYKIINTYPHDKDAYTQGLEYYNGFLYETTGGRGKSSLRKVAIKTGKVLQKIDLDKQYFGEGMTIFNDKIYWLTWKGSKGFVYDLKSFKQERKFSYAKSIEGWGLTHNDTELIKSDGTHKIWFLDGETQKEKYAIQVYTNKYSLDKLNEIELVNGKIYANKWQQNAIVIINSSTGIVEGVANLKGLQNEIKKTQTLDGQDEVLNGIAFDAKNNRLFVTGKHWGKLFEIKLVKQ